MNKTFLILTTTLLLTGLSLGPAAFAQTPPLSPAPVNGGFKFTKEDAIVGLMVAGLAADALSAHSTDGERRPSSGPPTQNAPAFNPFAPAHAPAGGRSPTGGSSPAPVPEASTSAATALMLLLGMGGLLSARRRRVYRAD